MMHKFKALGLAMVAVLAMSAVVASAAQAQFTSNAAPTTVKASSLFSNDVFTIEGSSVECAGSFESTAGEVSVNSLTVTATYTNCKAFGFASAHVTMNGCDYVFYAGAKKGQVDVVCPAGKVITIVAGNCEVQIGGQIHRSIVYLSNSHPYIQAKAAIELLTVNITKDGFLCPLFGTGLSTASYTQAYAIQFVPMGWGTTVSVH